MSGSIGSRSTAFSFLLQACRRWLDADGAGDLQGHDVDWHDVGKLAFFHNLEPLLHALVVDGRLPSAQMPESVRERWERSYYENLLFNTRAVDIIQPFCIACRDRGIPIAFVKGPIVSARVYGDPAIRVMADLDVLCDHDDLERLVHLARKAGFVEPDDNALHHLTLTHCELPLLLELHFQLYDFVPDAREIVREIVRATEPCEQGEFTLPALPNHLEIAVEIAHLVNHDLKVNLKPLLDLAGGLRRLEGSDDLDKVMNRWDLLPEAAIIGELIERLFATRIPLAGGELPADAADIVAAAVRGIECIEERGQPALEELAARVGVRARIRYLWRLLLPSRTRLEAVGGDASVRAGRLRLNHLTATARRGLNKLSSYGVATTKLPSIKRRVYRRR